MVVRLSWLSGRALAALSWVRFSAATDLFTFLYFSSKTSIPFVSELRLDIFCDLSGNMLTLDDLGQVMEEVLDVSAQWYHLGLQLKVRTGTLDRIRTQFHDPRDQLLEMLKTWLTTSDNMSWKTLTDALRSRSVGASQLAGVLETTYCVVEETEPDIGASTSETQPETNVNSPPPLSEQMIPQSEVAGVQASE